MAVKTAFSTLVGLANADMAARVTDLEAVFGWREVPRQQTKPRRVVWVPGDKTGKAGKLLGATKAPIATVTRTGQATVARNLADLDELFTVYVQAYDPTDPANEAKQYNETRMLFDALIAAIYRVSHGAHAVGVVHVDDPIWSVNQNEQKHGGRLTVVGHVRSPIPDDPINTAYPTTVHVGPDSTTVLPARDQDISVTPTP